MLRLIRGDGFSKRGPSPRWRWGVLGLIVIVIAGVVVSRRTVHSPMGGAKQPRRDLSLSLSGAQRVAPSERWSKEAPKGSPAPTRSRPSTSAKYLELASISKSRVR